LGVFQTIGFLFDEGIFMAEMDNTIRLAK